jgi:thioredoxin-like negative regulator of GroEL
MNTTKFKEQIQQNKLDTLLELLIIEANENSTQIDCRFQLAEVYVKLNDFAKAVNCYIEILQLDQNNEQATVLKESVMMIISQSQLDIYASPNTHLDPWH